MFCRPFLLVGVLAPIGVSPAAAQLPLVSLDTPHTVRFDGFRGEGFAPTPSGGKLDSSLWRATGLSDGDGVFGGTHLDGDFARGAGVGGRTSGGIYALVRDGQPDAVAVQATSSDFSPGALILRLINSTEAVVDQLEFTGVVWIYNDQGRSTRITIRSSPSDTSEGTTIATTDTPVAASSDPEWMMVSLSASATGLRLMPGQEHFVVWHAQDAEGSGGRDEIAISSVTLTPSGQPTSTTCPSLDPVSRPCWVSVPAAGGHCQLAPMPFGVACGPKRICDGAGVCFDRSDLNDAGISFDGGASDSSADSAATTIGASGCSLASTGRFPTFIPVCLLPVCLLLLLRQAFRRKIHP